MVDTAKGIPNETPHSLALPPYRLNLMKREEEIQKDSPFFRGPHLKGKM